MVVGENIAVGGDDESGAGGGGCGLEAPEVGGDGGGDAHGGIDVGSVNLSRSHFLAGVHGDGFQLGRLAQTLHHHSQLLLAVILSAQAHPLGQHHAAGAHGAADEGEAQGQGNDPGGLMFFLGLFRSGMGCLVFRHHRIRLPGFLGLLIRLVLFIFIHNIDPPFYLWLPVSREGMFFLCLYGTTVS